MNRFRRVLDHLRENKQLKDSGGWVGIPYPYSRLRKYIPVIEKGHSIGILAGTGVGKSRFTRHMFIYNSYKFAKRNNYPLKIYYFALEDNGDKVFLNMIAHYLKEEHGITITVQQLASKGDRSLPTNVLAAIAESEKFFEDFESYVEIIDDIHHPSGIFKYLRQEAVDNGKIEFKDIITETGDVIKEPVRYIPNDNTHRLVIVDNLFNFDANKGEVERDLMIKFCRTHVRKWLCNFYQFSVVQVMQMSFDKERQQFTNGGASIISKLEPSLDGIGEAKVIARSMHVIFGLFNPDRYGVLMYPNAKGYRIDILQNRFRAMQVLKCNDSDVGMRIGLYFDAVAESFVELPMPDDPEMEKVYNMVKSLNSGNLIQPKML